MGCICPLLLSPPRHGGKRVLAPLPAARPYPLPARHGHADSRGGSLRDGHARASPPVSGGSAGVDARSPVPSRDAEEKFDGVLDSAGRGSRSPTAAPQWEWDGEEVEGGDGEVHNSYEGFPFDTMDALEQVDGDVQSSYKDFPFHTMDALQEALPYRKGVSKFYNGKSGSLAKPPAAVILSPPSVKGLPKSETPSPRKRKCLLPSSSKCGKAQNKEVYPEDDVVDSPMTCRRMTLSPAATSSSGSNNGSDDEAQKLPPLRPPRRKGVSKFYNTKSGSFAKPPAAVIPSPPSVKVLPKPETPSPRKRKGLLPFSFKWGKAQNKEVYPEDNVVDSPMTCRRMTLSPAAATSSSRSNSGSDDEAQKLPPRQSPRRSGSGTGVFASPPTPCPPKLFPAHNRSQSMRELQDVTYSTAMVSPRDKRRKN